jgi:diacylglycerol O-acyltransferase
MSDAKPLKPQDAMFLIGETANTMMHVGGLMIFTPPADAGPNYLREQVESLRHTTEIVAPWNRKLRYPSLLASPLQAWVPDKKFDIEYHVRRSALPGPGDERELGILVSRLHSNRLDFSRPPWEMHLIEGLEGGRFALYVKVHHSLVDGYSAMQILMRSLSTDPDERDRPMFFSLKAPRRPRAEVTPTSASGASNLVRNPAAIVPAALDKVRDGAGLARSGVALGKALIDLQVNARRERGGLVHGYQAPDTLFNSRVGRNRRFATQQVSLPLLKELGALRDATLNDAVVSVLGGAIRRYLAEESEVPDRPLIAFLPVNIRQAGDVGGGNAVGAALSSMGTDIADPVERLDAVAASTRAAKGQLEGLSQAAILAYSAVLLAPMGRQMFRAVTGLRTPLPVNFNVCVSNVPGPKETRYLRGSRMEATYPVSIPTHGMALNVTLNSYVDQVNLGFIGDRDALPHLQKLAVYTGQEVQALREALGVTV